MADTPPPQAKLTPTKYKLGVGGLSMFATGGCLIWTVILIPVAIPMILIGGVMTFASLFIKTERMTCPACQSVNKVEKNVSVIQCPDCSLPIKRTTQGWARVT